MLSTRPRRPLLFFPLVLALGSVTAGCPDPQQAFDDFVGRVPPPEPAGECPDAYTGAALDGAYFMTLLTSLSANPIFFRAEITSLSGNEVSISLVALDKTDRKTPVAEPAVIEPVEVGADGAISFSLVDVLIPKEAAPVEAKAEEVIFDGGVCGDGKFICGAVSGSVFALGSSRVLKEGSTFTIQGIEDESAYPDGLLNCKGDPAPPLM